MAVTPGAKAGANPPRDESAEALTGLRRWLTPSGIGAIAGIVGVIATIWVGVYSTSNGSKSVQNTAAEPQATPGAESSPAPAEFSRLDPESSPTIGNSSEFLALVRSVAVDALPDDLDPYLDYRPVRSPGGSISSELPLTWGETSFKPWAPEGEGGSSPGGVALSSAESEILFEGSLSFAGLYFGVANAGSTEATPAEIVSDGLRDPTTECQPAARGAVRTGTTNGVYELWRDCGERGSVVVRRMTRNVDDYVAFLHVVMTNQRDIEAFARFSASLDVKAPIVGLARQDPVSTGNIPGEHLD